MLKISRKSPSGQKCPQELPTVGKMRFSKYSHIIFQSIAKVMYFLKNIRTICLKPTENFPQDSIAP